MLNFELQILVHVLSFANMCIISQQHNKPNINDISVISYQEADLKKNSTLQLVLKFGALRI